MYYAFLTPARKRSIADPSKKEQKKQKKKKKTKKTKKKKKKDKTTKLEQPGEAQSSEKERTPCG